jgi:hypothetical protein
METGTEIVSMEVVSAESIYRRLTAVGHELVGVARDYVMALDANTNVRDELVAMGVSRELLRRMERLGRGGIEPRLVFSTSGAASKVMALPLSEQQEILDCGVEVMSADGLDHRLIPLEELTPEQVRQVFGDGGVRTLAQQRTWMENEREARRTVEPIDQVDVVYKIRGKRVIFTRACEMTARQLAMILAEVE